MKPTHHKPFRSDRGDTATALLSGLAGDMVDWLGSEWGALLTPANGRLRPTFLCGRPRQLESTLSYLASFTGMGHSPETCSISEMSENPGAPSLPLAVFLPGEDSRVLAFGPRVSGAGYTLDDRELIRDSVTQLLSLASNERLGRLIADRLTQMNRVREDLALAGNVQRRFLPVQLARINGLDYHGDCHQAAPVGGDFFDFIPIDENSLTVSVGDVSGHGISSAILLSGLQTSLRQLSGNPLASPLSIIAELNRTVYSLSPDNFFATLFYARIYPQLRQLRYVSAGHEAALLIRHGRRSIRRLESTGTVLGLTDHSVFEERVISVEAGDTLIAITDGITDSVDGAGRFFQDADILAALNGTSGNTASDIVSRIVAAVANYQGVDGPDDRTVVVVRFVEREQPLEMACKARELELAIA